MISATKLTSCLIQMKSTKNLSDASLFTYGIVIGTVLGGVLGYIIASRKQVRCSKVFFHIFFCKVPNCILNKRNVPK